LRAEPLIALDLHPPSTAAAVRFSQRGARVPGEVPQRARYSM